MTGAPPSLREALEKADDLLRRLAEWDMLYIKPDGSGVTADGPFWQREIGTVRAEIRPALSGVEPDGTIPMYCSACGKPKPNDAAWARPALGCECGNAVWTGTVTFRG